MKRLFILMNDQLSEDFLYRHHFDRNQDAILTAETTEDLTYVSHHKKKIALILSSMRHFVARLRAQSYPIYYFPYDGKNRFENWYDGVSSFVSQHTPQEIITFFPAEWRLLQTFLSLKNTLSIPFHIHPNPHFFITPEEFETWKKSRRFLRMEDFYRWMRKKYHILMSSSDVPFGDEWNYDKENRKPASQAPLKPPTRFQPDEITQDVLRLVDREFGHHFGDLEPFTFAVTKEQAEKVFNDFVHNRLADFGRYQDVMFEEDPWVCHSHISFYINLGLLNPQHCVHTVAQLVINNHIPIAAGEGFIRQILGWREYVRGIYWSFMPSYKEKNYFNAHRSLPSCFWTTETSMNCLKQCFKNTKENAYAHHIQRLMVIGNFALLTGLSPHEVNEWYLIVYADAFEWVEMPNVTGMILFADGGLLGSKPYAASGAYIHKMSNYCAKCSYSVKEKVGEQACPFNYLYWFFLLKHQQTLQNNPRLSIAYQQLKRFTPEKIKKIEESSLNFLRKMDEKKHF